MAQDKIIDSLSTLDFELLKQNIFQKNDDSISSITYANAYLLKAKKLKDSFKITKAYHIFSSLHMNEVGLKYADSIFFISNKKNFKKYPFYAFYIKGYIFYDLRNFKSSYDNFIEARKLNKERDFNKDFDIDIDYRIGLIENRLGHFNKALYLFKKSAQYYLKTKDSDYYLGSVFAIDDTFRQLRQIDSSNYYNRLGYEYSQKTNNETYPAYFELNFAANLFHMKEYEKSLSKLKSTLPNMVSFNDLPNMAMNYYYIGMNYLRLNNKNLAIKNFLRVDSLYLKTQDIHPELRNKI